MNQFLPNHTGSILDRVGHLNLSSAHRLSKSTWRRWKSAGKSSSLHPAQLEYKEAKRQFRKLLKKMLNQQTFNI